MFRIEHIVSYPSLLLLSCCYLSQLSLVIFRTHQRCLAVIFCSYIDQMHKNLSALFSGSSSMRPMFLFIRLLLLILLDGNFPTTIAHTPVIGTMNILTSLTAFKFVSCNSSSSLLQEISLQNRKLTMYSLV